MAVFYGCHNRRKALSVTPTLTTPGRTQKPYHFFSSNLRSRQHHPHLRVQCTYTYNALRPLQSLQLFTQWFLLAFHVALYTCIVCLFAFHVVLHQPNPIASTSSLIFYFFIFCTHKLYSVPFCIPIIVPDI